MTNLKPTSDNDPNLVVAITLPIIAAILFLVIFLLGRYYIKRLAAKNSGDRVPLKEEALSVMDRLSTKELNIFMPVFRYSPDQKKFKQCDVCSEEFTFDDNIRVTPCM